MLAARGPPKITKSSTFPWVSLKAPSPPLFSSLNSSHWPTPQIRKSFSLSPISTPEELFPFWWLLSLINSTITRDACAKCASGEVMQRVSRSLFPKAKTSPCQPAQNIPCLPHPVTRKANTGNEQCKTSLFAFNQSSCSEQSKIMPFC